MNMVETFGLLHAERQLLDGDNLESGLFDLRENDAGMSIADRVRLDDAEGALRHDAPAAKVNCFTYCIVAAV